MRRLLILLLSLLTTYTTSSQPTLEECRLRAREHYPEIRQYDLIRLSENYSLSNARRAWLPQVTLSAQATWQNEVPEFPTALTGVLAQQGISIPGISKDQYKVSLELYQQIWDGGSSSARQRMATSEAEVQRHTTDVDLYALEERIDQLYFGILMFDEHLRQAELTQKLLHSNLDKIRALQAQGAALPSDADAVEAELLAVGQQLTQLRHTRQSYLRMLELFTGLDLQQARLQRPEHLTEPDSQQPQRPELDLFDARSAQLDAQAQQIKSATHPRIGIFAQGYYGNPGLDFFASMMSPDWSWNALVGIRLTWNFGAYYTRNNSLAQVRTSQHQIDVQRDLFLFNLRMKSYEQEGEIARIREALADDDRIVRLRQNVREAAEAQLRNGIIDTTDLLRKITDETLARVARSAREIELLQAICALRHTINQ